MPDLKIQRIISSSEGEEEKNGAENLLTCRRPWRGKPGVETNSVLLKLENEEQIKSIDIGNEGSAYISVAVGKSCDDIPTFNILIPETAFMDPGECRSERNLQRVKMFDASKMNASFAAKKWDLVKVVCKQPYNKRIGFGISFIKIFGGEQDVPGEHATGTSLSARAGIPQSPRSTVASIRTLIEELEEQARRTAQRAAQEEKEMAERQARIQQRREDFKEEVRTKRAQKRRHGFDDEDDISTSPSRKNNPPICAATGVILDSKGRPLNSIPQSQSNQKVGTPSSQTPSFTPSRILQSMMNDANKETATGQGTPKRRPQGDTRDEKNGDTRDSPKRRPAAVTTPIATLPSPSTSTASSNTPQQGQAPRIGPPSTTNGTSLPFAGVRFSLSGFQNPLRGRLRDLATALGGHYLKDVDNTMTHLICAFRNTPKAKQVGPSVKIISHHWVERCHLEKRKLREELFRL